MSVGLTPDEAKEAGEEITGKFPLAANGRALTMVVIQECSSGCKSDDHVILVFSDWHHVSELSREFTLALEMGGLGGYCWNYPCPPDHDGVLP